MYLLVGESGSGKSTIARKMEQWGYKELKSYTTREPRHEDEDGHIFITHNDFVKYDESNEIVAYTFFNHEHYFCTRTQLYYNDIYVIDPDGIDYLKQNIDDVKFIVIHIDAPLYRRIWRMFRRGDGIRAIMQRVRNDKEKFRHIECDYKIKNIDIKHTLLLLKPILKMHDWIDANSEEFQEALEAWHNEVHH